MKERVKQDQMSYKCCNRCDYSSFTVFKTEMHIIMHFPQCVSLWCVHVFPKCIVYIKTTFLIQTPKNKTKQNQAFNKVIWGDFFFKKYLSLQSLNASCHRKFIFFFFELFQLLQNSRNMHFIFKKNFKNCFSYNLYLFMTRK